MKLFFIFFVLLLKPSCSSDENDFENILKTATNIVHQPCSDFLADLTKHEDYEKLSASDKNSNPTLDFIKIYSFENSEIVEKCEDIWLTYVKSVCYFSKKQKKMNWFVTSIPALSLYIFKIHFLVEQFKDKEQLGEIIKYFDDAHEKFSDDKEKMADFSFCFFRPCKYKDEPLWKTNDALSHIEEYLQNKKTELPLSFYLYEKFYRKNTGVLISTDHKLSKPLIDLFPLVNPEHLLIVWRKIKKYEIQIDKDYFTDLANLIDYLGKKMPPEAINKNFEYIFKSYQKMLSLFHLSYFVGNILSPFSSGSIENKERIFIKAFCNLLIVLHNSKNDQLPHYSSDKQRDPKFHIYILEKIEGRLRRLVKRRIKQGVDPEEILRFLSNLGK